MTRALADVKTGSVTTAVRDTTLNGSQITKGDFIGLLEGDIVVDTKDPDDIYSGTVGKDGG